MASRLRPPLYEVTEITPEQVVSKPVPARPAVDPVLELKGRLAQAGRIPVENIQALDPPASGPIEQPRPLDVERVRAQQQASRLRNGLGATRGAAPPPPPGPAPAAAAPPPAAAAVEGQAAKGALGRAANTAGNVLSKAKALPGKLLGGTTRGTGAGLLMAGGINSAYKAATEGPIDGPVSFNPLRMLPRETQENISKNPFGRVLNEYAELPATAANVLLDTGKNALGMLGFPVGSSNAQQPASAPAKPMLRTPPVDASGRGRNPAPRGGQTIVGNAPVGASAQGDKNGGYYDSASADQVIGTFNGRPITKGMSEMIGSKVQVFPTQGQNLPSATDGIIDYGGSFTPGIDARAINSRYDKLVQEVNDAHRGRAGVNMRLRQLMGIEDERNQALGIDKGTEVGAFTQRRGQNMDMDTRLADLANQRVLEGGRQAGEEKRAQLRAQLEQMKYGTERADKNYDRVKNLAESMFTQPGEDGKPVANPALAARFLAEAQQNAPQLFTMDPTEAGPLWLEAQQRFMENQQRNAANGTQNSTWAKGGRLRDDVSMGDAISSSAVGATDVLRDNLEWLPGVDDASLLTDDQGRTEVIKGTSDVDKRRRYPQ